MEERSFEQLERRRFGQTTHNNRSQWLTAKVKKHLHNATKLCTKYKDMKYFDDSKEQRKHCKSLLGMWSQRSENVLPIIWAKPEIFTAVIVPDGKL